MQDNKNEEKKEEELDLSLFNTDDNEEVEFDDNIDIDALQAKLQQHMATENIEYTPNSTLKEEDFDEEEQQQDVVQAEVLDGSNMLVPADDETNVESFVKSFEGINSENNTETEQIINNENVKELPQKTPKDEEKLKLKLGEKKYVIYIEPDNIDFIENLTVKERKKVINRILRDEDFSIRKKRTIAERKKFATQVVIMVLTVIISLPIFFTLLNKSIEMTILNYQQAQQNFVKLYKEQGKIKSYKNFQKNFN